MGMLFRIMLKTTNIINWVQIFVHRCDSTFIVKKKYVDITQLTFIFITQYLKDIGGEVKRRSLCQKMRH